MFVLVYFYLFPLKNGRYTFLLSLVKDRYIASPLSKLNILFSLKFN